MKVAVIGLGHIGGSVARAVKEYTSAECVGFDKDHTVLLAASLAGAMDRAGTDDDLRDADLIVLSVFAQGTVDFLREKAPIINKNAVVIDTCGIKRAICAPCFEIAKQYGFCFIGGHPMAGTQYAGFAHSRANMFKGTTMIMCAPQDADMPTVFRTREFFLSLGFGNVHFVAPEEHDRMIAYTSQLAHVVSSSYIRSPQSLNHKGFSAGSYKDMTRVAQLNPDMWTELFLENADNLSAELDCLIGHLQTFSDAIKSGDCETLRRELAAGSAMKQQAERG